MLFRIELFYLHRLHLTRAHLSPESAKRILRTMTNHLLHNLPFSLLAATDRRLRRV